MLKTIAKMACRILLVGAMFAGSITATAQSIVNGIVKDVSGEPLIGATVRVKGTQKAVTTDVDGKFAIAASNGSTIQVTYIGYKPAEMPAKPSMDITLKEDISNLSEVVVIGYGSVKRKDVTTAISTVSSKELENRPIVSAAQAIQGKAAGVQVVSPNGAPGGEMSIRVRGTTSFNGSNDPLYVVDGVSVDNINFLSPSDIDNIQILKDASSAAIYGSQAANGVILITTKSGTTERPQISFNAQYAITQVRKTMDVLNAAQYKELQDEIGLVSLPDKLRDRTDWFDEIYSNGSNQNYQLSISQVLGNTKYLVNLGYLREDGVIKPSFYNRYNFRMNLETKLFNVVTATANVMYSDYSSNGINTGNGAGRGGVILAVINTPTYAPVYDPNNPGRYYNNFYGLNITSPAENVGRGENARSKENRLIASGNLLFNLYPGLTFNTKFTLDRRNGHSTDFIDPDKTSYGRENYGIGTDTRSTNQLLIWDNVANYILKAGKNRFDIMAGVSWTKSHWTEAQQRATHYRNGTIQTLNVANKVDWNYTGTNASSWALLSYFGRVAYNFDDRYLLTANIRADGSSKLHPDYRWGVFPSFSAAWRLSQEKFMRDIWWINDLKIRGGWGKTGNQTGIGDYAYLQRYYSNRVEWFVEGKEHAMPTLSQENLRTTDLKWETTTQTDIGFDLAVLHNRLSLSADFYWKKTTDMLMYVTLPTGAAASNSITRNEGEMTNRGFEFTINSHNLTGEFSWDTSLNMSFNRNKLSKLALQKIYSDGRTSDYINETVVRNEPGRALGGFYGYISDGVDPETGDMIYRDLNGDGKISSSDRTYIGDPNPDFTYGMTNTFSYKGFNLSIFIQGSYGNDIFNASRTEMMGMYDGKNQITDVLRRWRIPGQITDVPRAGFDLKNSTYFVEDGSYLRVKDITLSYSFSGDWMRKVHISKLQPYFTATNLLTWTSYSGMDPEVNQWGNSGAVQGIDWGTYPQTRSFTFGVNIVL